MPSETQRVRWWLIVPVLAMAVWPLGRLLVADGESPGDPQEKAVQAADPGDSPSVSNESPRYEIRRVGGKVVWFAEALSKRHGIESVPEAADRILAIQSPDGALVPLIEDVRGRAFRNDHRLRELEVELVLRFYQGVSAGQILGVYSLEKDGKFELDYWCDVCAIAMYELKACECCQGETRLRRRPIGGEDRER